MVLAQGPREDGCDGVQPQDLLEEALHVLEPVEALERLEALHRVHGEHLLAGQALRLRVEREAHGREAERRRGRLLHGDEGAHFFEHFLVGQGVRVLPQHQVEER